MVLEDEALLRVARGLMEEVVAGARADGAVIAPSYIGDMIAATESMGHYKSSMQIDYETGRPLEVESILGDDGSPLRSHSSRILFTPLTNESFCNNTYSSRLALKYSLPNRVMRMWTAFVAAGAHSAFQWTGVLFSWIGEDSHTAYS